VPCTRCARRERAHRQGRARAGGAPQRDVGRPLAALRGDGGACCGHTAARRVLRRRRSAAAGRYGTAGGSAAELGDGTQLHGARFGPHSLPASAPPPPPRRAQQAVRSGCCAGQLTLRAPARVRVVFADGAQVRAREGRGVATRSTRSPAPSWAMPGPALHPRQTQQAVRIRPAARKSRPSVPLCNVLCGRGCSQG
jgi:hypothetical protein